MRIMHKSLVKYDGGKIVQIKDLKNRNDVFYIHARMFSLKGWGSEQRSGG